MVNAVSPFWYSSRRYVHLTENVQKLTGKRRRSGMQSQLMKQQPFIFPEYVPNCRIVLLHRSLRLKHSNRTLGCACDKTMLKSCVKASCNVSAYQMQTAESQQSLLVRSSFQCGNAGSSQKSSGSHCPCMARQSIIWSLFARSMQFLRERLYSFDNWYRSSY